MTQSREFDRAIALLCGSDTAAAAAGAALAIATMEVAKQARVANLIDYLAVLDTEDGGEDQYERIRTHVEAELGLTGDLGPVRL